MGISSTGNYSRGKEYRMRNPASFAPASPPECATYQARRLAPSPQLDDQSRRDPHFNQSGRSSGDTSKPFTACLPGLAGSILTTRWVFHSEAQKTVIDILELAIVILFNALECDLKTLNVFIKLRNVNVVQSVEPPIDAGWELVLCNQCLPMKKGSSVDFKYTEEAYRYCKRSGEPGLWKVIQTQGTDV